MRGNLLGEQYAWELMQERCDVVQRSYSWTGYTGDIFQDPLLLGLLRGEQGVEDD